MNCLGGSGMFRSRQITGALASLAAGTLAVTIAGAAVPALAATPNAVTGNPANGTPQLSPNGQIEQVRQLVQCGRRMYAVGKFTRISQGGEVFKRRNACSCKATAPCNYYASLNARTGHDDRYLRLRISGHSVFPGVSANRTRIYNQQLSRHGKRLLVEGDFTSVRGKHREQIFMLNLRRTQARVSRWRSAEFLQSCATDEPFYIHDAAWSPDSKTVYTAATGGQPFNISTSDPRSGLCDAAAAFPSSARRVHHIWVNYTGCDSLYSTIADRHTAYFAGHERWANNSNGCNEAGPGAIPAQGMVGLRPSDGSVIFNPTRSQGLGADDMLLTSAGLWIASDNFIDSNGTRADKCAKQTGHAGICFLPY